jgi:type III restriction enzyme
MRQIILLTVRMNKVVQHVFSAIRAQSYETLEPVFNSTNPIRSTTDVRPWYTGHSCEWTQLSHINFVFMIAYGRQLKFFKTFFPLLVLNYTILL